MKWPVIQKNHFWGRNTKKANIAFLSTERVHANNILILSVTGDWGLDGGWERWFTSWTQGISLSPDYSGSSSSQILLQYLLSLLMMFIFPTFHHIPINCVMTKLQNCYQKIGIETKYIFRMNYLTLKQFAFYHFQFQSETMTL